MNTAKLVCPDERALIDRLERRSLCVRVSDPQTIAAAAHHATRRNSLFCVICDSDTLLSEIETEETWRGIPIAWIAPAVGPFRHLSRQLALLRTLNLRVYLPATDLIGARLLTSVGIPTCVMFDTVAPDWDILADLMIYTLLDMAPHAPIEPFQTIAEGYRQTAWSEDWGRVWFHDPLQYLHVDDQGRVALSRRALLAGDFIAHDVSELDTPTVKQTVADQCQAWQAFFAHHHFCTLCKAWRICHGRFATGKTEPDGCADFFCEMMTVIEQRRDRVQSNRVAEIWQP